MRETHARQRMEEVRPGDIARRAGDGGGVEEGFEDFEGFVVDLEELWGLEVVRLGGGWFGV